MSKQEVPDRNTLARENADLRDELDSMRKELLDAWETASRWAQWAESVANKKDGLVTETTVEVGSDSYNEMLDKGNDLIDKFKDHWYEVGYAQALRELRNHLSEAIADWADKQGIDIRGV